MYFLNAIFSHYRLTYSLKCNALLTVESAQLLLQYTVEAQTKTSKEKAFVSDLYLSLFVCGASNYTLIDLYWVLVEQ